MRLTGRAKEHVKRYLNEGNDVNTADEFHQAIDSHGGIKGVMAQVCKFQGSLSTNKKIESTSLYKNFDIFEERVTVWKALNNGQGKIIPMETTDGKLPEYQALSL